MRQYGENGRRQDSSMLPQTFFPRRRAVHVILALALGVALLFAGWSRAWAGVTPSVTTVTSSKNPSLPAQAVTFTATVTGAGATPTGTATFTIDGLIVAVPFLAGGTATYTTSTLGVGNHTVSVQYSGDATFATSTGVLPGGQWVDATTTTVTETAGTAVWSQPVTFTATVAPVPPAVGVPTGTVTFLSDGTPLTTVPLVAGSASFTTSSLAIGPHNITAAYSGSAVFTPSVGVVAGGLTVTFAPTTTTLTAVELNGLTFTFAVNVTATTPAAGPFAGTVTLTILGIPFASTGVGPGASAVITASIPQGAAVMTGPGTPIVATYSGDAHFSTSSSVAIYALPFLPAPGGPAAVPQPPQSVSTVGLSNGCNQVVTPVYLGAGAGGAAVAALASGLNVTSIWVFNNATHTFQALYFAPAGPADIGSVSGGQSVFVCGTGSGFFRTG
jgi:hypothetical protein